MIKKRNRQDGTTLNIDAAKKREAKLERRVMREVRKLRSELEERILAIELYLEAGEGPR